jgi:predicted nucleic acid-binding protein
VILLDTSALVDSLTGSKRSEPVLKAVLGRGDRLGLPVLVLYEWLRGPRTLRELEVQEILFPPEVILAFETPDARLSARLYSSLPRARTREFELAIAAIAIRHDALLWTLNTRDFADIPQLRLFMGSESDGR